ncbi:MAG TPA: BON domain-containing protein [Vicinamibacterales bacterium]
MIRALLRVVLLLIVVAAIAAFFFGYRIANRDGASEPGAVGTTGTSINVDRARQAGAKVGEAVAEGANEVQRAASDAGLTAKIKSKMTLDDRIDAAAIDVDTSNGVVTLSGSVDAPQQRERAVQLARETDGVTSVIDQLTIQ